MPLGKSFSITQRSFERGTPIYLASACGCTFGPIACRRRNRSRPSAKRSPLAFASMVILREDERIQLEAAKGERRCFYRPCFYRPPSGLIEVARKRRADRPG